MLQSPLQPALYCPYRHLSFCVKRQQITVDAAVGHTPNQIEANVQFLHTNFCRHANMAYLLLLWASSRDQKITYNEQAPLPQRL